MLASLPGAYRRMAVRVSPSYPDRWLVDGEVIRAGHYEFRVVWTPGHTSRHACLYSDSGIAFCGDHVLERITPAVMAIELTAVSPLGHYLTSLNLLASFRPRLLLTGHRAAIEDPAGRISQILAHHGERLKTFRTLLSLRGTSSAHEVAKSARWGRNRTWEALGRTGQRIALMETVAHLDLLVERGHMSRMREESGIRYAPLSI